MYYKELAEQETSERRCLSENHPAGDICADPEGSIRY